MKKILTIFTGKYTCGKRFLPIGFYLASSILNKNGFEVECLDLSFHEDYKSAIISKLHSVKPDILGFSICSASNYKFAMDIIMELNLAKQIPIVFGGQHMRSPTKKKSLFYTALEGDLEKVGHFYDRVLSCYKLESLDYSLIPNTLLDKYYPSIEVSRGCWNHCRFCNSNNLYIEKGIDRIEKELQQLSNLYPRNTIVTLAGSNNLFTNWRKKGLIDVLQNYSDYFYFNFNLGVESGWEYEWDNLKRLNLWNVFVGIESCDEKTLLRMRKSKRPSEYVKKASDFLQRCKSDGVYVFATYIYGYPGHTVADLDKLDNFLMNHSCNNIVQMGFPCEAYPGTSLLKQRSYYKQLGVKYHEAYPGEDVEYYLLDISRELTHDYLTNRSKTVHDIINTKDRYALNRCKGRTNE